MSTQNIVERILSDATAEAQSIVADAERKAAEFMANASEKAEAGRRNAEKETAEKAESILEKRAAAARLESAKILLAEKRKVIDTVYSYALNQLVTLPKEDCLKLTEALLERYAESGDELYFAENYKYAAEAALLPVIKQKGLALQTTRLPLDGGMKLIGKVSDKDLSYGALLAIDRENHQAALAKKLFK